MKKKIIFSVPIEIRIEFLSIGSDKKNKKARKEILKWLSGDLKNLYVPVGEKDLEYATVTRIKIGKIT